MQDCFYYSESDSILLKKYHNPSYSFSINSSSPEVFSLSDGVVSKIIQSNNSSSIIIRNDHLFFVYSNIVTIPKNITLEKYITNGSIIGIGGISGKNYSIDIQIYKGTELLSEVEKYIDCKVYKK